MLRWRCKSRCHGARRVQDSWKRMDWCQPLRNSRWPDCEQIHLTQYPSVFLVMVHSQTLLRARCLTWKTIKKMFTLPPYDCHPIYSQSLTLITWIFWCFGCDFSNKSPHFTDVDSWIFCDIVFTDLILAFLPLRTPSFSFPRFHFQFVSVLNFVFWIVLQTANNCSWRCEKRRKTTECISDARDTYRKRCLSDCHDQEYWFRRPSNYDPTKEEVNPIGSLVPKFVLPTLVDFLVWTEKSRP